MWSGKHGQKPFLIHTKTSALRKPVRSLIPYMLFDAIDCICRPSPTPENHPPSHIQILSIKLISPMRPGYIIGTAAGLTLKLASAGVFLPSSPSSVFSIKLVPTLLGILENTLIPTLSGS